MAAANAFAPPVKQWSTPVSRRAPRPGPRPRRRRPRGHGPPPAGPVRPPAPGARRRDAAARPAVRGRSGSPARSRPSATTSGSAASSRISSIAPGSASPASWGWTPAVHHTPSCVAGQRSARPAASATLDAIDTRRVTPASRARSSTASRSSRKAVSVRWQWLSKSSKRSSGPEFVTPSRARAWTSSRASCLRPSASGSPPAPAKPRRSRSTSRSRSPG